MNKLLVGLTLLSLSAPVATAAAAPPAMTGEAAMRQGIRDFARVEGAGDGATASRIRVDCAPVAKVGATGRCTGTFRLTKDGARADYRLTARASTLRLSPKAIEYRLAAVATAPADGLPLRIGLFAGFLQ